MYYSSLSVSYDANGNVTNDPLRGFEMSYNLLNLASQVRCRAPGSTGQNSSVVGETVYYADGSTGVVSSPAQSIPHWELGERYQHFGARAYDPLTCTFMQTDPLAEKYYGTSPYAYCGNNPVMFVDPDGEDPIGGGLLGGLANYTGQVLCNWMKKRMKT